MAIPNQKRKRGQRGKTDKDRVVADAYFYAFKKMGGKTALLEWAKDNKDEFFKQFKQIHANKKASDDKKINFVDDL